MPGDPFPETVWTLILAASDGDDSERAAIAFRRLCADYRDAIAHWMRLQRLAPEDAEDAAHEFLEGWLQRENPLRGFQRRERRFREFLRTCLRRFLADRIASQGAARRGGHLEQVLWESREQETHPLSEEDASICLDFALAAQIHRGVLSRLQDQWRSKLAPHDFERLQAIALGDVSHAGYTALAAEFGATVGAVKTWIFRLRREYHNAFREAVRRQADELFIDQDLLHLRKLLLHPPAGAIVQNGKPV